MGSKKDGVVERGIDDGDGGAALALFADADLDGDTVHHNGDVGDHSDAAAGTGKGFEGGDNQVERFPIEGAETLVDEEGIDESVLSLQA